MKRWAFRRTMKLGLVLAMAALAGCDILDEGETPTSARLIIEGGAGQAFHLVTSNDFTVVANSDTGETGQVILNEADTVLISAPLNERYSLGSGVRFFLKVFPEQPLSQPINVKVLVGGTQRYNSTSALDGLTMEFVYTYR